MRPFLRWEYALTKAVADATGDTSVLISFRIHLESFCFIKYAEFPITIDELRAELKQPPHPDTIQGLPDSRGKKFLNDANVDKEGDDIVPKFAIAAIPEELQPLVLANLQAMGVKVES